MAGGNDNITRPENKADIRIKEAVKIIYIFILTGFVVRDKATWF